MLPAVQFPLPEEITITYAIGEHPTQGKWSWADDGHPGFQWFLEQTNIRVKFMNIPQGNIQAKMQLMLSTNELPDILNTGGSGW